MTKSDNKRSFQVIEEFLVERDVFDAKETSQNLNSEFVVFDSVDVLAELFNHDFLDYRLDHSSIQVLI